MVANSSPRNGTGTQPPPVVPITSVFQLPCRPIPGSSEPVRRRSHASSIPSAENRISTPGSTCSPAQTTPDTSAPGQNPNRRASAENRNPRMATSSVHGATITARALSAIL